MTRSRSQSDSPPRKRQRLSSPTYEDQLGDLTQEDLAAFDELDANLSQRDEQSLNSLKGKLAEPTSSAPASSKPGALQDDPDIPFMPRFMLAKNVSLQPAAFQPAFTSFKSASALPIHERSPSPEQPPPEPDYDNWFQPAPADISKTFEMPVFAKASVLPGFGATPGFTKLSGAVIQPSEKSLAEWKAKLEAWEQEDSVVESSDILDSSVTEPNLAPKLDGFRAASHTKEPLSPKRPAFSTLSNVLNTPKTPTPTFSRPVNSSRLSNATAATSQLQRPAVFKSPFQPRPISAPNVIQGSPLNPNRPATSLGFASASGNPHPLSASPFTAPTNNVQGTSAGFATPLRSSTPASAMRTRPAKFVTPFKPNMRPGETGRLSLPQTKQLLTPTMSAAPRQPVASTPSRARPAGEKAPRKQFFSLTPSAGRQSLESSGLRPQQYEREEYESYGIDISMLNQITPETALFYVFHDPSSPPIAGSSKPAVILGPAEALRDLLQRGCALATKPWVDNHWCLILWKLAGMVALNPEKESIPVEKRWCWAEVLRQLLYRYERELNSGLRPPLRKIANQDAPAEFPMVLCISNIFWSPAGLTEDGMPIEPHPELEVTDGWYRLRAQVDLPMARAVRRGIIRAGRKIGVAGAKLSSERKEPSEILEAYNSTKLVLSGNSSHLMPWHAKLGFMQGPCISTLHSLAADGGVVSTLDFVITKIYPIAFLEFIEEEDGQKRREGPRNEVDEGKVHDNWQRKREIEASKLREELDKKFRRFDEYITRLEGKAGSLIKPLEDDPPEDIESLYDRLEYPDTAAEVLSRVNPLQAAWLARYTRQQVETGREAMADEIDQELQKICPPRQVRSFRVLVVQDAQTRRRPAHRTAQVTVWDVLSLTLDEGSNAGTFAVGHRYMTSNLIPTQQSAWMDCEPGSEVYLSTRRDTRWTRIRTSVPL